MTIVKLNLARNCLKYLIKVYGIKEIFTPYYTCETVWTSAKESGCKISFYHIDKNFMPIQDLPLDAFIVYTNYYGLCTKNCSILAKKYPHIIIDNAQAFYAPHCGMADFNSLRKFFPVQNGAYLCTTKVLNERFSEDNLELPPTSAQENFEKFVYNELQLNKEKQIKTISADVERTIENFDFANDKKIRQENFKIYKRYLEKFNNINLSIEPDEIPYCYPFSPNQEKIKSKIAKSNLTLIQLWKNFPQSCPESKFLNDTIALPLTDSNYVEKIISTILD